MFDLLFKLFLILALAKVGSSIPYFFKGDSRSNRQRLMKLEEEVLNVDWKPIILFPKEAKRFE